MIATALIIGIGVLDWKSRRIPNALNALLAAVAYFAFFWQSQVSLTTLVLNIIFALAITLPGYIKGIVGGGDVKLMLAIAPLWPSAVLLQVFATGVLLVVCLLKLQAPLVASWRGVFAPSSHTEAKPVPPSHTGLPLGTAIALGAALHLLTGEYLLSLLDVTN